MKASIKTGMTAHKLMILLASLLFILFALTAGAFVFVQNKLTDVADDVAQVTTDAEQSRTKIQQLQQTEQELDKYTKEIERAAKIVAESQSYRYQDQIINDITDYANRAGVTVTSFSFSDGAAGASGGTATPATPTTPQVSTGEGMSTAAAGGAPKSTNVVVNLGAGVRYENLLRFMSLIERNLTKMQIANVTLSKGSDENKNSVSTQSLNLEVFIQ